MPAESTENPPRRPLPEDAADDANDVLPQRTPSLAGSSCLSIVAWASRVGDGVEVVHLYF